PPEIVEDVELPDATRGLLGPRGEDDLGVAVVVQIDHHRLTRKAEVVSRRTAGRDGVRPAPVLGLVEPVGVDLAVVGRKEYLLEAVPVEIGHDDVLIPHAEAVARLAVVARRPAGTNGAVGLEDVELAGRHAGGLTRDDLELAVFI